ncbi:efflux RND transporter periplasmic adaptor subunit [Lichenicoccus sp.]|uniref:efflux RND transporter periplasmic adaptor subunit n=1 Tax=Lichenicoccus sp. TaxID=2781899 RepID=UPI003D118AD6
MTRGYIAALLSGLLLGIAAASGQPDAALAAGVSVPTVLVTTQMPKPGTLPDRIEAYGTAVPARDGTEALSLLQDGRVRRILHAPGEAVRQGEPVLEWDASAAAMQAWEQARSGYALAQQQRSHAALLLARHLATRDQLDQADKALADAAAALDGLRREGADQAMRLVRAPFDGIIVTLAASAGEHVAAAAPLATLARRDRIVVTVGVDPARMASVHAGQPATVQALAGGPELAAAVRRVDAALDPRSRLVDVDLAVPAGAVLPGADCAAAITVGTLQGWLLPHAAVLQDAEGSFLFQIRDGKAVRVPVTVLGTDADTDLVSGALEARRAVVLDGAAQLSDGAAVRESGAP